MRLVEGVVHRISAFSYVGSTATMLETVFAHRLIASLLVQEVQVTNPSEVPLILTVTRGAWRGKASLRTEAVSAQNKVQYQMSWGEVRALEGNFAVPFALAAPLLSDTLEVPAKSKRTFVFRTFVNYTTPTPPNRAAAAAVLCKTALTQTLAGVEQVSASSLLTHHSQAWRNLWKSGFGISLSRADGALNGDAINATIYLLLSHKSSFAQDAVWLSDEEDSRTSFLLDHPDRCYAGNPTLQAPGLWAPLRTPAQVRALVGRWLLTLEKNGCRNLLAAGAEGLLQAVLLSFVGMQFHQSHLEMGIHPKQLHRDYLLRRVRYSNRTSLNVAMSLGDDNKASIFVALDQNADGQDFFACDAGCLDPPVLLTDSWKQLPVKLTEPLTAILYVTPDRQHIHELKHAIHVQEVAVAPAHEHQLIAMHRHGHRLGGLPALFWAAIVVLIVIFHLFLVKLIYNEYCGSGSPLSSGYERMRRTV